MSRPAGWPPVSSQADSYRSAGSNVSNLPYRRFPIGRRSKFPTPFEIINSPTSLCRWCFSCNVLSCSPRVMGQTFNTIESVLTDLRRGKMVIVVDDADRENEGDLIMGA